MSAIINDLKQLYELLEKCETKEHIIKILNYDMETSAPIEGMKDIAKDINSLSEEIFKIKKSSEYLLLVTNLYKYQLKNLSPYDKRLITLLYRDLQKEKNISSQLDKKRNETFSNAYITWLKAKEDNSYVEFKDTLKNIYQLETEIINTRIDKNEKEPYETIFSDYEYGFTIKDLDKFFDELEKSIVPLFKEVKNSKYELRHDFLHRKVSIEKQMEFSNILLEFNGFDFKRGTIATTEHPFTEQFSKDDVRVTTHYFETNFISNMYSVIHEGGHALFGQNISEDVFTHHLGEGSLSMAKHESVSRFYENIIGRSKEYIHAIYPKFKALFSEEFSDVTEKDLYEGVNYIDFSNLLRTEADELTYSLHILIRYKLEKEIMKGNCDFDTLDQKWNQLYKDILLVDNKDAKTGILQDVHWSSGFGYFPTYALGNALNCMYVKKLDEEINFKETVKKGDMKKILNYLSENIFSIAPLYDTKDWIKKITNRSFSANDYIAYLTDKYTDLYHLKKKTNRGK